MRRSVRNRGSMGGVGEKCRSLDFPPPVAHNKAAGIAISVGGSRPKQGLGELRGKAFLERVFSAAIVAALGVRFGFRNHAALGFSPRTGRFHKTRFARPPSFRRTRSPRITSTLRRPFFNGLIWRFPGDRAKEMISEKSPKPPVLFAPKLASSSICFGLGCSGIIPTDRQAPSPRVDTTLVSNLWFKPSV